jgi:hypothetical protein
VLSRTVVDENLCTSSGRSETSPAETARGHTLHDLILRQTCVAIRVHAVTTGAGSVILDVGKTKRPSSILVTLELGDGSLGGCRTVETYNTSSAGSTARLVLDLGLFDLANSSEEFDEILVASGPRELGKWISTTPRNEDGTNSRF